MHTTALPRTVRTARNSRRIALAVLAACGATAAQAQSSVQLYGLLDVSAGRFDPAGSVADKGIVSGNMTTSYFGFKGNEDLGGGLNAHFAIESYVRLDTGAFGRFNGDTFWARNAFVGFDSKSLGTLDIGRNTTSLFISTLLFNAIGNSFGFSPMIRQSFSGSGVGAVIGDTAWSDSVAYYSPNFSGLTVTAMANANDAIGTGRNYSGQALYFNGDFAATAVYQRVKNYTSVFGIATPTAGFDNQGTYNFGASYVIGPIKLYGQYTYVKTEAALDTKAKIGGGGVSWSIGDGKLLAQYGRTHYDGGLDSTSKTATVAYDHYLSKRTDVYAVFMNDKRTGVESGNTYAAGIRHRF